jgi:hypothetical protein
MTRWCCRAPRKEWITRLSYRSLCGPDDPHQLTLRGAYRRLRRRHRAEHGFGERNERFDSVPLHLGDDRILCGHVHPWCDPCHAAA